MCTSISSLSPMGGVGFGASLSLPKFFHTVEHRTIVLSDGAMIHLLSSFVDAKVLQSPICTLIPKVPILLNVSNVWYNFTFGPVLLLFKVKDLNISSKKNFNSIGPLMPCHFYRIYLRRFCILQTPNPTLFISLMLKRQVLTSLIILLVH